MKRSFIFWSLLFACNLMWSLQFTCIKLTQEQVGPNSTVLIPMFISACFMLPFVYRQIRTNKNRKPGDLKIFALLALFGQFPAQVLTTTGTQQSTASNAAIISLSLPVVSALLAFIILNEKMNYLRWVSFIIAIAGVMMSSMKDIGSVNFASQYLIGNLLIFAGVAGSAFYNTMCKRIAEKYTEMEMLFYTYLFMIVLLLPIVLLREQSTLAAIPLFTKKTIIGLTLLTVFHNFLSMILFFVALKHLQAIQVALSNFLITFFALPIAAIWLGETLSFWQIGGGLLVLLSTLSITVLEYRHSRTSGSVQASSLSERSL